MNKRAQLLSIAAILGVVGKIAFELGKHSLNVWNAKRSLDYFETQVNFILIFSIIGLCLGFLIPIKKLTNVLWIGSLAVLTIFVGLILWTGSVFSFHFNNMEYVLYFTESQTILILMATGIGMFLRHVLFHSKLGLSEKAQVVSFLLVGYIASFVLQFAVFLTIGHLWFLILIAFSLLIFLSSMKQNEELA